MKERKTPYSSRLYHLVVKLKLTNPKREQNTKQMNELNTKQRRRKVGKSEGQVVSKKSLEKHVLLLILASNSFKILGQGGGGEIDPSTKTPPPVLPDLQNEGVSICSQHPDTVTGTHTGDNPRTNQFDTQKHIFSHVRCTVQVGFLLRCNEDSGSKHPVLFIDTL